MSLQDERDALVEIANLLPNGYVKTIPFSTTKDISFDFKGVTIKMSALYVCESLNCYCFDLAWGSTSAVYGIPIRCGVNLLAQYSTPLPNMYAYNHSYPGSEVTSWRDLDILLFDEQVLVNG